MEELRRELASLSTEAVNREFARIDEIETRQLAELINQEDAKVSLIIRENLDEISRTVDAIVARMRLGGRLIYCGAGTAGRLGVLDAVECVPTFNAPPGYQTHFHEITYLQDW
jgi:N-acetylmuramic acid 6-phosphate etherase